MKLRVGQSLGSAVDTTTLVVVRCPVDEVTVTCGGQEMTEGPAGASAAASGPADGGLQLGKRYTADELGVEVLCTKGGQHPVAVNGTTLAAKTAQPLPASD